MTDKIHRRQFLQAAGAVAAGTGLGFANPQTPEANAEESINKTPRLLAGCCAYSYGPDLRRGRMTMEDFILKAVELRLDGIDMTAYYFKSTEAAYLAGLRHLAYKNAVPFSGAACGVSMVQADAAKRAQALAEIKNWVDVADQLGAPHLRVFAGKLPPGATLPQAIGWVVEIMKAASDYSGKKGIMIGVEDHSGVTQNAGVCLEVMHRVDSPYAGINLDITHFIPTPTQDAYAQIAACIPYATNTHIRDYFDDHTPVDMDRVWRLFSQAGFKGYMSAEYERDEDPQNVSPATGVPKLVAKIRNLCKQYSSV